MPDYESGYIFSSVKIHPDVVVRRRAREHHPDGVLAVWGDITSQEARKTGRTRIECVAPTIMGLMNVPLPADLDVDPLFGSTGRKSDLYEVKWRVALGRMRLKLRGSTF